MQKNISVCKKLVKYIIIGLVVMISVNYIPENKLDNKEIIMIGAITSITYALLDMISPTIKIKNLDPKKVISE